MRDINLKNYCHGNSTELLAVGALSYLVNHLTCNPRNELCIYKYEELEQTFIDI